VSHSSHPGQPEARSILRRTLLIGGIAVVILVVASTAYLLRDPRPHFAERRSGLASVQEGVATVENGATIQGVTLTASSGLTVRMTVRRELADSGRRLPAAVILGGHVTGAEAARLVGSTPDVAVIAVSYPFAGDPRPGRVEFLKQIPAIRAAFLDTPPAVLLVMDYLHQRGDVDTTRIEGVGVSLGVPFMTIAGALDQRFSRIWALHGSGGSYAPLEASMRRTVPLAPLRVVVAGIANVIIAGPRLAPERWVGAIAPRPFMIVNAEEDERLPRDAVDALFAAAGQPKEMIRMSGGHIHGDAPTIRRLVTIVMSRVTGNPAPKP
jgi:dienelactone hydrolase